MPRRKNPAIPAYILAHLAGNDGRISSQVQAHFNVSKQTVSKYLAALVEDGLLLPKGTGRGRRYYLVESASQTPPMHKDVSFTVPLSEAISAGEDILWKRDVLPRLSTAIKANVRSILQHGFTEIVNNALDHSGGCYLIYKFIETASDFRIIIEDDGVDVFKHIRSSFDLPNEWESVAELAKGKRTTMPERHAGEDIFFTSRSFDTFSIAANGLRYAYFADVDDWTIETTDNRSGTLVELQIGKDSPRQIDEIFAAYTSPDDFSFDRGGRFNIVPYTIAAQHELVSRSEAKRLMRGAEKFRVVILDLKEVPRVGQAFVDEVFRVWAAEHPETSIIPKNMVPGVEFMVKRGLASKGLIGEFTMDP